MKASNDYAQKQYDNTKNGKAATFPNCCDINKVSGGS